MCCSFSNIGVEADVIPFWFEDLPERTGPLLFDDSNKQGCSPSLVFMFLSSYPIFIQKHNKAKNPKGYSRETL